MSNEEFQSLVLKKLDSFEGFQTDVLGKLDSLENGLNEVKVRMDSVESGLSEVKKELNEVKKELNGVKVKLDAVYEQTAFLTEFKAETEQQFVDIKNTLDFVLHKEVFSEKEVFFLKMKQAQ